MRKLMKTKVLSDIEPLVARLDHLMAPSDALRVLQRSGAAQRRGPAPRHCGCDDRPRRLAGVTRAILY